MNGIYELKETLCKQLEEYGKKGEMSPAILERVDMLAHAAKNLDKIIENYEGTGYSGNYRSSYDNRGYSMKRDSMGRYSRNDGYSRGGDLVDQLRDLMGEAHDDRTRQEMQRLVSRLEQM
jgi:hypothetical protein